MQRTLCINAFHILCSDIVQIIVCLLTKTSVTYFIEINAKCSQFISILGINLWLIKQRSVVSLLTMQYTVYQNFSMFMGWYFIIKSSFVRGHQLKQITLSWKQLHVCSALSWPSSLCYSMLIFNCTMCYRNNSFKPKILNFKWK